MPTSGIVAFFSFKDGIAYDKDHVFDANVRASITPNDVVRYLKKKAYGDPDADVETANPTEGRSSSLEFYKKTISFFIPMRNAAWNPAALVGNPTRSVDVNELIKVIRKSEVRKQGKKGKQGVSLKRKNFFKQIIY